MSGPVALYPGGRSLSSVRVPVVWRWLAAYYELIDRPCSTMVNTWILWQQDLKCHASTASNEPRTVLHARVVCACVRVRVRAYIAVYALVGLTVPRQWLM